MTFLQADGGGAVTRFRAVTALLLALCAVAAADAGTAWAGNADPATGEWTETIRNSTRNVQVADFDSGQMFWEDGSGQLAYCAMPGYGSWGGGKARALQSRRLAPSDFPSERMYRGAVAALYYGPGGPGYDSLGKSLYGTAGYRGSAVDEDARYCYTHWLLGYYYQGGWDGAFTVKAGAYPGQGSDASNREKLSAFYSWGESNLIPTPSGSGQATIADRINSHANDADMLANGGFTFDEFARHLVLAMGGSGGGYNLQDFLMFDGGQPELGSISLAKHSANPEVTDGNACYSLAGASYGIFRTEEAAASRRESEAVYVGATGQPNVDGTQVDDYFKTGNTLTPGDYWVSELAPSEGYALDTSVYKVTVRARADVRVNAPRGYVEERPLAGDVPLWAGKVDAATGTDVPEGSASLADAEFTVRYYDGYYGTDDLPAEPKRTWIVKTDEEGRALAQERLKVSGPDFYEMAGQAAGLPLGTFTVVETRAPAGYRLDDGGGGTPKLFVFRIEADGSPSGPARVTPVNYADVVGGCNAPAVPDSVKRIGFKVAKEDAPLGGAQAEGDATLEGAVFSVVNENTRSVVVDGVEYAPGEECATAVSEKAGAGYIAQLPGDALPYGNYTIREKVPPTGYLPNQSWSARIAVGESTDDGHVFDLTGDPCADMPERGGMTIPKIDRELGRQLPLGSATLAGAEMEIVLAGGQPAVVDGNVFQPGEVVKTVVTGADGTAATGHEDLPYGTYTVRESKAPGGYLVNHSWSTSVEIRENGGMFAVPAVTDQVKRGDIRLNKANGHTMARLGGVAFLVTSKTTGESHVLATDENGSLDTSAGWTPHSSSTNANDGALRDGDGESRAFAGRWRVESAGHDASETPPSEAGADGLVLELRTDGAASMESGEASETGAWRENPDGTATVTGFGADATISVSGDSLVWRQAGRESPDGADGTDADRTLRLSRMRPARAHEIDSSRLDAEAGVWFSGSADLTTPPDDSLGALPYDTYSFRELASEANEGLATVEFDVRVYRDSSTIDMGTVDDRSVPVPAVETELAGDDGAHTIPAHGKTRVVDAVRCSGLDPGRTYTVSGTLMDKSSGEPLEMGGRPVSASATFKAAGPEGSCKVTFDVDSSDLDGSSLVAFERLIDSDGREIASHEDIDDTGQTVGIPSMKTFLTSTSGGKSTVARDGTVTLLDRIDYTNLEPGMEYTLSSELHGKTAEGADAGIMTSSGGNAVAMTQTFTPDAPDGSVTAEFSFPHDAADELEAVAFEELSAGGTAYAVHADIADPDQTVVIAPESSPEDDGGGEPPEAIEIRTVAAGRGKEGHDIDAGEVDVTDTVSYRGLSAGKPYLLKAALVDRETGRLLESGGETIEAAHGFTPETGAGSTVVTFPSADYSPLAGRSIVAFEELYEADDADGAPVAVHRDISDPDQTLRVAPAATWREPEEGSIPEGTPFDRTGNLLAGWRPLLPFAGAAAIATAWLALGRRGRNRRIPL